MLTHSPFAQVAENLREQGYHVLPIGPGTKYPGEFRDGEWRPMPGWQKYCDTMPPEFISDQWERWADAGIGVAHGAVIGLDLDTDRRDVSEALHKAVTPSPVRRRGQKGWMGYYRPGDGLDGIVARLRWYDPKALGMDGKPSGSPVVEVLLHGTQSVLPPSIHPDTGKAYTWLTPDSLADVALEDLPEFGKDEIDALDREFTEIGLTRQVPRRAELREYERPCPSAHDLEKPFGRSVNDRAMMPDALDQWWPALGLPKTKQRGPGAWASVPIWRGSGSGRANQDRNPNLKATPQGIVDFGADRAYTPVDVVMAARDCSFDDATEWLGQYIAPEVGPSAAQMLAEAWTPPAVHDPVETGPVPIVPDEAIDAGARSASRFKDRGVARKKRGKRATSEKQFRDAFPQDVPPFPVQDYEDDLTGLLREATLLIEEGANMGSDQGAFGAALAALGVIMGRCVEIEQTGLRTNLYIVGTAESGAGKSSAMSSMAYMMSQCGIDDRLAGSDFTSGSAILKEMSAHIPQLFNVDEFGDVIRRVLAPRAASHERDIGRVLKDMYSSASGTYRGKAYATQDRQDIVEPHMCLYGVSTHEAFWESIDGRSFNDGLLARFIMIPIGETETQTPDKSRMAVVRDMITNHIASSANTGNLGGTQCKAAIFAPGVWDQWMTDRSLFQSHARRAEIMRTHGAPSIINRICENGMKIAMISAMGRDPERPEILAEDYSLGIDVAHWSAIYMIAAIEKYYVENASHRDLNRVREFIEARAEKGCTKQELYAAFQGVFVNGMAAKSILDALTAGGKVVAWEDRATGGRPKQWFVSAAGSAEFFARKAAENGG